MTKKPSGERSSVPLVNRPALFASVRVMRIVSTPHTSVASRAAISLAMNSLVGTSTFPPRCPHFLAEESWSSKCTPAAPQRILDPNEQIGDAVRRIEALVGVHRQRAVRVGRHLPAADVDRLEPRFYFLHRLVTGERREHRHIGLLAHQLPETRGPVTRKRMLDRQSPSQPIDVLGRVGPSDALPPPVVAPTLIQLGHKCVLVHTVTPGARMRPG